MKFSEDIFHAFALSKWFIVKSIDWYQKSTRTFLISWEHRKNWGKKKELTTPFCSETLASIFSLSSLATTAAAPFALISLAIGATLVFSGVAEDPLLCELLPLVFGVPLLPFSTIDGAAVTSASSIFSAAGASWGASDSVVTAADGVSAIWN